MVAILKECQDDQDSQLPVLIAELRKLLKDDKHLTKYRTDDEFLIKFLRVRAYNVPAAFIGLQKYYQNVDRNRPITKDIRPSNFNMVFEDDVVFVLKKRDKFGSRVGVCRTGSWNINKFDLRALQLATIFIIEEITQERETQLNGATIVFDLINMSMGHVRQHTASEVRRMVLTAQDGLPMKVSAVHFINYPSIFWALFYVVQRFLKEKIRKRIHFHSNLESLHRHLDPDILPRELGGQLGIKDVADNQVLTNLLANDRKYEDYYWR